MKKYYLFSWLLMGLMVQLMATNTQAQTRYVSTTGTQPASAATSWANSTTDLQGAINSLTATGGEVWVAAGVYTPTTTTTRTISFSMANNVAIYGGFVGSEMDLSERPAINPITGNPSSSTLSGDIGSVGTSTDNSHTVVRNLTGLDNTAVLDGFVITGGYNNANSGTGSINQGGGMVNDGSNPTVRNCLFTDNQVRNGASNRGGAMYNNGSNPVLTNCLFANNQATGGNSSTNNGGAMYNNNSSPVLTNCLFASNQSSGGSSSTNQGGGMMNQSSSSPVMTNCTFANNQLSGTVNYGVAMFNRASSNPVLTNCTFTNNQFSGTLNFAGAMSNANSYPILTNCVVFGNGSNTFFNATSTITATYSLFEASALTVDVDISGPGNLTTTTSPFVSAATGTLTSCAPAIDAGNPATTSATVGTTDLLGNPRFFDNPGTPVDRVDMGAVEFQGTPGAFTVVVAASPSLTISSGNTITLTASGADSYTWTGNVQSATFTASPTTTTIYSVTGLNASGCTSVTSVTVVVACPTSLTVNDLGDAADLNPGDGICATSGGVCTLRAAIQEINATTCPSPFTITVAVSGTINLTSALPHISKSVSFYGPGANNLAINRSSGGNYRLFNIANVSLTVRFDGFSFLNGNSTGLSPNEGGGIRNIGTLTVTNCIFSGNVAPLGGGLFNLGTLVVDRCQFTGNSATSLGGGILQNSLQLLTVNNTTFSSNTATSEGGGIQVQSGPTVITNSLFQSNVAGAYGGGLSVFEYEVTISNTTFSSNTALTRGGAINNAAGSLTVTNITCTQNRSTDGGGVAMESAGTAAWLYNSLLIGNTDLAGSTPSNIGSLPIRAASSYNIIGTGPSGGLTNGTNNNQVGVSDVLLAPLGNYGGPTQTYALLPGSPAINAGTSSDAPTTDQRGTARSDGAIDIGAFESRGFTLAISSGNNQSATVSTAFANPLRVLVSSSNSEPVDGGVVSYTVPASGASVTLSSTTATIASGTAAVNATANATIGGPYNVTAGASGSSPASVQFALTNTTCPSLTITASPSLTVASGSTVTLTASGASSFSWSSGQSTSAISVTAGSIYSVTGTTSGCSSVTSVTVVVCPTSLTVNDLGDGADLNPGDGICATSGGVCTLRAAIQEINATTCPGPFTITVAVSGTINLTSALPDIGKDITFIGPGASNLTVRRSTGTFRIFTIPGNNTVSFDGFTIADGSAGSAPGGGINNAGRLTVANCILRGNQTTRNGGGIYNTNQLIVTNTLFTSNTAASSGNGGGIASSGGSSTLSSLTITANTAQDGGGISTASSHSLVATNMLLQSNTASSQGGGLYASDGTSNLSSLTIIANKASFGGGICTASSHSLVADNSLLQSNTATGSGGGLYAGGGTSNLSSLTITANRAVAGGGICTASSHSLVATNTLLQSNTVTGSGGGLYAAGSMSNLSSLTITANRASLGGGILTTSSQSLVATNTLLQSNTATNSGGGLYAGGDTSNLSSLTIIANWGSFGGGILTTSSQSLVATNTLLQSNTATGSGGGLYAGGGTSNLSSLTITANAALEGGGIYASSHSLTATNTLLQSNSATGINPSSGGGGLYANGGTSNLSSLTITANTAQFGGGISTFSSHSLVATNTLLKSNTATSNGGGLYANGGTSNLSSLTILENMAQEGGGISTLASHSLTATASLIQSNTATGNNAFNGGGGFYAEGGTSNLNSLTITANRAYNGGGISTASSHSLVATNTLLQSNSSTNGGGGIFASGGRSNLSSLTVTANTATYGGGIATASSHSLVATNTLLQSNSADGGGGLYAAGSTSNLSSLTIIANRGSSGGGINTTSSHSLVAINTLLQSNTAANSGGGIFASGGRSDLSSLTITANAAQIGGGIFTRASHSLVATNTLLQSNTATGGGGGLYAEGSTSNLSSLTIIANTALAGGGIATVSLHSLVATNTLLQSNTATNAGGGLYAGGGTSNLSSLTVTANMAPSGGGIYTTFSHSLVAINTLLQSNTAGNSGGGLYGTQGSTGLVVNSLWETNAASTDGGAMVADGAGTSLTLTNASIRNNTAPQGGAITQSNSGSAMLVNNVVWGNGSAANALSGTPVQANYSLFETGTSGFTSDPSNLTTNVSPFANSSGAQLRDCSPAIDAGSNAAFTGLTSLTTDLAGNDRFYNAGVIDLGAAEFQGDGVPLTSFSVLGSGTVTCASSPTITLSSSETGVSYQLRRDGTNAGSPVVGTGLALSFGPQSLSGLYTVLATGVNACTALMAQSATVVNSTAVLSITIPTVNTATAGVTFNQSFTALSGVFPYAFSLTNGTIPVGLTLTSAGQLNGIPTQTGTFAITVLATDANSCSVTGSYSLVVNCPSLTINTPTVATATAGVNVPNTLIWYITGTSTYSFNFGGLPPGLSIANTNPNYRAIGGTPTQAGVYPVSLTVTNEYGCAFVAEPFNLTVNCPSLTINTPTVATATAGVNVQNAFIWYTTGIGSYSFDFGGLLPGLGIVTTNTNYRVIGGTPTQAGVFPVSLTVTNEYGCAFVAEPFNLTVNCPSLTVNTPTVATATAGINVQNALIWYITGTSTYSFNFGGLPPGLSIANTNPNYRSIGGTPTQAGVYPVSLTVTNEYGCTFVAEPFNLTVNCPSLTVNTPTVATATIGINVPNTLIWYITGTSTYSFNFGGLPPGLSIANTNPNYRSIGGTPTQAGVYPVSLTVTNEYGCTFVAEPFNLTVNCGTMGVSTSANPATCGATGSVSFTTTLPNGAYSLSYVGAGSPTNVNVSANAFTLTGLIAGTYSNFSISQGGVGCVLLASTTVTLSNPTSPTVTLTTNQTLTCASPTATLTATSGLTNYSFSTGQNGTSNLLTVTSAGTYSVVATGANGCTALASATVQSSSAVISASLVASGAISCSATSVTLTASPANLTYVFGGGASQIGSTNRATVSSAGTYSVTVTDAGGCSAVAQVTVTGSTTAPTLLVSPTTATLTCASPSVILSAIGSGTAVWSTNVTGSSLTVSTGGIYSVTLIGSNGCSTVASATVVDQNVATTISSLTASGVLSCSTTVVGLQAVASGLNYQFRGPGGYVYSEVFGSVSSRSVSATGITQAGVYTLVVSQGASCSTSQSVTVVQSSQAVSLSVSSSGGIGCGQSSAVISVVAPGATSFTVLGPGSYSQTSGSGQFTVVQGGAYTVVAGSGGCSARGVITIAEGGVQPVASNFRSGGVLGSGRCSVPLLATATGDRYAVTGASGYVYSNVYRTVGTRELVGFSVNQPGTYTLTVYSGSCVATYTTVVTGTACSGGQ